MSASFEIQSATGPYRVRIENHAFASYMRGFKDAAIIADEFFRPQFERLGATAIFVEATEANKSLNASPALIEQLRKSGATRQTELIAVGGGIVQDLSAFVASVYMRGLSWSYLPTTVLAMVDSCIGGKSSINVGPYKNLVGTIHPPRQVLIDPSVVETLPLDQRASGLIEAAKICFCRGAQSFERYLACKPSVTMGTEALEALIVNSLESKKWFIEVDEFDKKERLLLNFGHTFGHAIEGASHFAISHGIAVGLGILCALSFERQRGTDYRAASQVGLLEQHLPEMISSVDGLKGHLRELPIDEVLQRFASDKKHGSDDYALILVAADGEVALRRIRRSPEITREIKQAVQTVVAEYS